MSGGRDGYWTRWGGFWRVITDGWVGGREKWFVGSIARWLEILSW